jgi:hypothetical protein
MLRIGAYPEHVNEQRRKPQTGAGAVQGTHCDPVTVRPPFDPEDFARNAESSIRLTEGAPPPPLPPTMPPPPGLPEYPLELAELSGSKRVPMHRDAIPALAVATGDLDWFDLSQEALKLLLQVNGHDSVATISARCGIELTDAISVLDELAREGLIASSDTRE